MGFINVVITIVTKIGHSHDRHHVFDNVGGIILIVFRVTLVVVFVGGCVYTYRGVRQKLKDFLLRFALLGFIYVSSMPVIVFFANMWISAKDRH